MDATRNDSSRKFATYKRSTYRGTWQLFNILAINERAACHAYLQTVFCVAPRSTLLIYKAPRALGALKCRMVSEGRL